MMCGIFCKICYTHNSATRDDQVLKRIQNRGPNWTQTIDLYIDEGISGIFCGSVLWMQGPELYPQPVNNSQGVLLYNGDIFDETWSIKISDTQQLIEKLNQSDERLLEQHIIQQLKSLKGPFALIYYDKVNKHLYFTRDKIGRSSLLFHSNNDCVVISNVLGRNYDCVEVPATHMQILDLTSRRIKTYSWDDALICSDELSLEAWLQNLKQQQNVPDDEFKFDYEQVDLSDKDGVISHIKLAAKQTPCMLNLMEKILEHSIVKETVIKLTKLLENSIQLRLKRQPNKCKNCLHLETNCSHCTVGILFSGGLDCTILAVLADKYLPKDQSIDLINVAFKKEENASYDVPDRITGKQSFQELKDVCTGRQWIFREVNITKEELLNCQENIIGDLVYPRQTILDESLGTALWFASRGKDNTNSSTSRILLVGSGADELFGGYIRHRNAFKRYGWEGLNKELQLDWKRISFRNLARDNRVICDHGRQPRMPYLGEDFTTFVLQLKPWLRCFPSEDMGMGIGDKLMLRLVAFNLGLTKAAVLPKRALQFGSRIANKKEKGSDISKTFIKKIKSI